MQNIFFTIITFAAFFCNTFKKSEPFQHNTATGYITKTIQYKSLPGVNADLLSLDMYSYRDVSMLKPVIIYVHGGGWRIGDKANNLENKTALFNSLGYIFISVNYRLSPVFSDTANPRRIKYPDHNNDVADAVKWVIDSIKNYGGNPEKIVLLGHSSGAQLVSLTGTSPLFLPARNVPLSFIKGIASIDTEGYDVTSQSSNELYQNAFGTGDTVQKQASAIFNLTTSSAYPRFFIAKRGTPRRIALADAFINKLKSVGVDVSQVNGSQYDHKGINDVIGNPDDLIITPALKTFLQLCFQ